MAITIQQANAASHDFYDSTFWEQVYFTSPFLKYLKGKGRTQDEVPGGEEVQFPIDWRELGTGRSVDPDVQIRYTTRDTLTGVKTRWAFYEAHTLMTWRERVVNSSGPTRIVNLMARKAKQLKQDLNSAMARDVFTKSARPNPLNSLTDLVSASAFGGVDEPVFRASVKTALGALGWYGDADTDLAHYINGSLFGTHMADLMLGSPQIKTKLEGAWAKATRLELTADADMVKLGIPSWSFMGAKVMADQFMQESAGLKQTLYGLETNAITLYEHREGNAVERGGWESLNAVGYPRALLKNVVWVGQSCVERRRTMFRLDDITSVTDVVT